MTSTGNRGYDSAGVSYFCFRIPAVVRTKAGVLLAFAEGRAQLQDHGKVDLVLKRSFDGGRSWSPLSIVHSAESGRRTIGNPAPLYDPPENEVVLFFCRQNQEIFVTRSTDDGVSWSSPMPIGWARPPEWAWIATGPPAALRTRTGRWLLPCNGLKSCLH